MTQLNGICNNHNFFFIVNQNCFINVCSSTEFSDLLSFQKVTLTLGLNHNQVLCMAQLHAMGNNLMIDNTQIWD